MSGGPGGASRPDAQQVRVWVEGVAHAGLGADRDGGVGGGEGRAGAAPPAVDSLVWEDYQAVVTARGCCVWRRLSRSLPW